LNPSASDWIPKYLSILEEEPFDVNFPSWETFYTLLKEIGFIYGVSLDAVPKESISNLNLTREEFTKVNLFHALLHTYISETKSRDYDAAIAKIIDFYEVLDKAKTGFLNKITLSSSLSQKLEKMLAARLHETNTFLNKGVTGILTYALLYIDVLAFKQALHFPRSIKKNAEEIEKTVITCCYFALNSKKKKNKYDRLLIELFESSAHYLGSHSSASLLKLEKLSRLKKADRMEKKYLLDICTISVWDDHKMDEDEYRFLQEFTSHLGLTNEELEESLKSLAEFTSAHQTTINLFEYANPVKLFYKQSTATVKLLILRNKKRLQKELEESGELLVLLTESTVRELTDEEKTKVKHQILDICKTIPSLTVFLLPGGTVLLPILIKFIPKLLPSAFRENRIDKK
jgi:hypothetical protein